MKARPNIAVEEDTEEMNRWRSLNQCEMDLCWKNLADRMEQEVLDKYNVEESKKGTLMAQATHSNGEECGAVKNTELESEEKIAGQDFFTECNLQRLQKASRRSQQ